MRLQRPLLRWQLTQQAWISSYPPPRQVRLLRATRDQARSSCAAFIRMLLLTPTDADCPKFRRPSIAILNGPLSGGSWLFVCPNHAPVRHNSGQATISRVRNIFVTLLPELVNQYRVP